MNRFAINTRRPALILLSIGAVLCLILAVAHSYQASAASAKDFNAGRIIDDTVFYNSGAMNASQIQAFLNTKVPNCDTNGTQPASDWGYPSLTHAQLAERFRNGSHGFTKDTGFHAPPYTCLRNFKQNTPQMEAASGLCSSLAARTNRTAAQIIDDVAKACGISPQVLIVLLQKEMSLVTDNWPLNRQYRNATGFACPDTAPCDPKFNGFFYQVYHAARQFKVYKAYPTSYNYIAGRTNRIYWNPDLSRCGSSQVYIQNQATAALYIYTPYRPNQAALNNLYGTGDSCSAYGNRNFWRLFTDWFGSTVYTVRGAIGEKYNSLGGSGGVLGQAYINERCGLSQNGCYQTFQGGAIYWTPATGAHTVWGGIRGKWSTLKYEAGQLAYPITDEICGLVSGGCYQQFQNGRIYWSQGSGAWPVWGGIGQEFTDVRSENGRLGYPLADEQCRLKGNGCYQQFQNGRIYWSQGSGAWTINGAIADKYYQLGAQDGSHRYPLSREVCGLSNGGCYQQFQNGRIYWSQGSGAWQTWGAIGDKYVQYGGHTSNLGYPLASEVCGISNGGCYQQFQGGRIYWSQGSGAQVIYGDILTRYAALGNQASHLRYPTGDVSCGFRDSGCYQQFQNGRIYWSQGSGAWPVWGGIGSKYLQLGGLTNGSLGYPTSGESYDGATKTWSQQYQHGIINYSDAKGAWVVNS